LTTNDRDSARQNAGAAFDALVAQHLAVLADRLGTALAAQSCK